MPTPCPPLNNGVEIPQLGFGVFQIKPEKTAEATRTALEIGYRHIDTAQMYGNEKGVGEAVRESGLDRGEIFVTSKVNNNRLDRDAMLRPFDESLAALGFDYLDLFLIHWPLPAVSDYVARWKAMEEIYASGRVKAIGVSNFQPTPPARPLRRLGGAPRGEPGRGHPFLAQEEIRAFDAEHGIVTEAWSPIARGKVADDPVIRGIAEQLGRTPAQVTLRWHVQRGDVVFPKSVTRARMEENFAIFDFELDESQMAAITALDRGERTGPNPDEFNWIPEGLSLRRSAPPLRECSDRRRPAGRRPSRCRAVRRCAPGCGLGSSSSRLRDVGGGGCRCEVDGAGGVVVKASTRPSSGGSRSVKLFTRARMRCAQT